MASARRFSALRSLRSRRSSASAPANRSFTLRDWLSGSWGLVAMRSFQDLNASRDCTSLTLAQHLEPLDCAA
jgi:hypothetical protein